MMNIVCPPTFVGGVGGSGTRVVTDILIKMGTFMGDKLKLSNDYKDGDGKFRLIFLYWNTSTPIFLI